MPSQNRGHVLFKSRQRAIRCLNPVLAAQIIAQRVSFVGSRRAIVQEHFGQIAAIERIGRRDAGMLTDGQANRFSKSEKCPIAKRAASAQLAVEILGPTSSALVDDFQQIRLAVPGHARRFAFVAVGNPQAIAAVVLVADPKSASRFFLFEIITA